MRARTGAVRSASTDRVDAEPAPLSGSAADAAWLTARQHDGRWRAFPHFAGESTEWATAYVAFCLARSRAGRVAVTAAGDALMADQRTDGGWGWHPGVPSDADSTAWACLALMESGRATPSLLERAGRFLLAHQDPVSGGISTFVHTDGMAGFIGAREETMGGWSSPHTCVTATVLQVLTLIADPAAERAVAAAARFLLDRQGPDGLWRSYWWTGPMYPTLHALSALQSAGADAVPAAAHAAGGVLAGQSADGSWRWREQAGAAGGVFETANAILALTRCQLMMRTVRRAGTEGVSDLGVETSIARAAAWLTRPRSSDEAASQKILQIPGPSQREGELRRPDGSPRRRVRRFADPRAEFTTATALWALNPTTEAPSERDALRSVLEQALAARGLRLGRDESARLRAAELLRGARAMTALARSVSVEEGWGLAGMESSRRFLQTLAFGVAVCDVVAVGVSTPGASDPWVPSGLTRALCGVWNVGISLLDRLWDTRSPDGDVLAEHITEARLLAACEDRAHVSAVRLGAPEVDQLSARGRVAAEIVWLFFATLHRVCPGPEGRWARRRVAGHLIEALQAERVSVGWFVLRRSRSVAMDSAWAKSVLPFETIALIVEAAAGQRRSSDFSPAQRAGQRLGRAIAQLDDLVDLQRDAESGDLNTLLLAPWDNLSAYAAATPSERLARMYATTAVIDVADEICAELAGVLDLDRGVGWGPAERRRRLLWHVNAWSGLIPRPLDARRILEA